MADADFSPGDLVLRERFLLIGPAELPPLQMFRPVPHDIGTVEIAGEAPATDMCYGELVPGTYKQNYQNSYITDPKVSKHDLKTEYTEYEYLECLMFVQVPK